MAHTHRTEKDEAEFKPVPEPLITLCINNCGVVATPATNNMCQNCFTAKTTSHRSNRTISTLLTSSSHRNDLVLDRTVVVIDEELKEVKRKEVSRCSGCKKRVGLTGFRCRCGDLFCSEHRYSDRHECSYDYKSVGREAIARENPVVKAAKIVRI